MSKCQNVSDFLAHVYVCIYACMYAHVCAYACKNVFSADIFDILTFLALNSLIYKNLTDLQKFVTRTFIFASPKFLQVGKKLLLWRSIVANQKIFKLLHA